MMHTVRAGFYRHCVSPPAPAAILLTTRLTPVAHSSRRPTFGLPAHLLPLPLPSPRRGIPLRFPTSPPPLPTQDAGAVVLRGAIRGAPHPLSFRRCGLARQLRPGLALRGRRPRQGPRSSGVTGTQPEGAKASTAPRRAPAPIRNRATRFGSRNSIRNRAAQFRIAKLDSEARSPIRNRIT